MPEIKIANQDTLLDVKGTAEATKSGVDALLERPAVPGFHFFHELQPIPDGTMSWKYMTPPYPPANFTNASAALCTARTSTGAWLNGEYDIYLFGSSSTTSTVAYKYQYMGNKYTQLANAPVVLYQSAAATINYDIYVLSGYSTVSTKFHKYSPYYDTWTPLADTPVSSTTAAVGVINNELYVAGGTGSNTSLRKYTPSNDSWTTGRLLFRPPLRPLWAG